MKKKMILSKLIAIAICAIMLTIALPIAKVNAVDDGWVLQVHTTGSNLNVRSGPGTNYSIIGKFANGTHVMFGFMDPISSTDWTYVWGTGTDGEDLSGYCNNAYLIDYEP